MLRKIRSIVMYDDDDDLLSKRKVCEKCSVAPATIDRWEYDPRYQHLGFPKRIRIGFKVFWSRRAINTFIQAQLRDR